MATTLTALIDTLVYSVLQDQTNKIRWSRDELTVHLNNGLADLASRRPESSLYTDTAFTVVSGSRQTLPTGALRLVRIERNANSGTGGTAAVRRVSHRLQTALSHLWHAATATLNVEEYMYNPRLPTEFFVYPPGNGSGHLVVAYSRVPTALTIYTGFTATWGAQTLPVGDEYAEALGHFVLSRAFMKEAEYALQPARADLHLKAYMDFINAKTIADREEGED